MNPDFAERKKLYLSREWRKLRAAFLKQNPRCSACGAPATVVDHVQGHSDPGWRDRFFVGPFAAMCAVCHGRKSARFETPRPEKHIPLSRRKWRR